MKSFPLLILIILVILIACLFGLWQLAHALTWHEFITPVKRGFYNACMVAIFFYASRTVRAVALYFEAKARKESR